MRKKRNMSWFEKKWARSMEVFTANNNIIVKCSLENFNLLHALSHSHIVWPASSPLKKQCSLQWLCWNWLKILMKIILTANAVRFGHEVFSTFCHVVVPLEAPVYLSSQSYMADSSLSEEMSQFDFSTGVQSFSFNSQNPEGHRRTIAKKVESCNYFMFCP